MTINRTSIPARLEGSLLALMLGAFSALPAQAQQATQTNIGDRPFEDLGDSDVQTRRERLREYFSSRRATLEVVATTVTESGQIIDWVPRDSQVPGGIATPPALDDQGRAWRAGGEELVQFELSQQAAARGPAGTIPILRRDTDGLLDNTKPGATLQDFLSKYGRQDDRGGPEADGKNEYAPPGAAAHEYAYSSEYIDSFGGHGNINVWNPYVYRSSEFSLGQVAVVRENGGGAKQTIEAGWQDYRNLYGDYYPHFFIYYTTNGYASSGNNVGGYNLDVNGFVQYSNSIFPGARLTSTSSNGGSQYSVHVRVQLYSGNWWIRLNNTWVGYYPASLFATNGLRNKADKIAWYGEVVDTDDGVRTYTDMGSGQFPSTGWTHSAYMRNIRTYNINTGYSYDYNPGYTWESSPGCYELQGHFGSGSSWDSYFWFGGPGRSAGCM